MISTVRINPFRILPLFAIMLLGALSLRAQTGTLTGQITDAESKKPLSGATIRILGDNASTRQLGAISRSDGEYTLKGIPPGRYRISVTYLGYMMFESGEVAIKSGETSTLDAALAPGSIGLNEVVISASRRPEKITSAPASVTVVDARRIEERPALTTVDHLKSVQGLDIVQSGLTQSNVVARGFNNAFSGSMMVLSDNRIASVPSLRLNAYNFIPLVNEDIQQIEVIRGPGSALYGPNTANGVLHLISRSPFSSQGTWFSVAGGERDLFQAMGRHAGTIGEGFGYKISAQYMRGTDWGYSDSVEREARASFLADTNNRGVNPDTLKIGLRDSSIERVAGEVRFDYTPTEDLTAIVAVGANRAIRNPDITGVGGAQARDWQYTYYQARVLYKDLFLQAFLNQSDAGKSYLLRTGQPVVDRSTLFVAQAQHATELEGIGRLAYGIDYLMTTPVTDSTITGGNEDNDRITEIGGYVQGEWNIVPEVLELVAAGRLDKHSRLDDVIFSPRAALVYTPVENQTVRATFNTAYSSPSTNDLFLDIVAQRVTAGTSVLFDVRASGVPESGFRFNYAPGGMPLMHGFGLFGYDPAAAVPIGTTEPAWRFLQELLRQGGFAILDSVAPPPAETVEMRMLDNTGSFTPVSGPVERAPLKPTINSTFEIGYNGVIADRLALSVDLYRSQYHNFVGPLQAITPNVFFQEDALRNYLLDELGKLGSVGGDSATLAQLAAVLADTASKIPFGVVSPFGATDPAAVVFASRNYGDITLYGVDLGLRFGLTNAIALSANLSYVDKNFFPNLDNVSDLSLNAPKFKYSVAVEYRDAAIGFNGEARLRHVDGFPVNSGVFVGRVPGYTVVDLQLGYQIPFVEGLTLAISAQNLLTAVEGESGSLFTQRHAEFVGTPALGRLVIARLAYEFK